MNKAGDLPLTPDHPTAGRGGQGREEGLAGLLQSSTLKTVAIKHN